MKKHWREKIAITNDYVIKSSINWKQTYFTKLNNELNENINEPEDCILDEFIPFESYKYKVAVNCLYKNRKSEGDPKTTYKNFRTEECMTEDYRLDLNQWLEYSRETYEDYGYDYEFIGVTDIQLSLEKTKIITRIFY